MRPIKFRAAITTTGKYCFGGRGMTLEEISHLGASFFDEDVTWLAFTGLLDKNEKEIYEGDIVKCVSELVKIMSGKKTGKYQTVIYSIVYVEKQARFATKNPARDIFESFALTQDSIKDFYEVIGNVHQNPDLLER